MLQQQKCLQTLAKQKRQSIATQSTKQRCDDIPEADKIEADAVNARILTVNQLNIALNTTRQVTERTDRQHAAAKQQQVTSTSTTTTTETADLHLPGERKNAKNIGITAKYMLNAAAPIVAYDASNITDLATFAALNETHVAEEKGLERCTRATPLSLANECASRSVSNLTGNMLPQHAAQAIKMLQSTPSVIALNSAERRRQIAAAAKTKAATFKNKITTTTITNQRNNRAEICEVAAISAPTTSTAQQERTNTENTIDFNSRRRRGRLRSPKARAGVNGVRGAGDVGDMAFGSGITGGIYRALLWLATYLEKLAASGQRDRRDPLLYLLSVLLSLIVVNVNRVARLVNEFEWAVHRKQNVNTRTNTSITTTTTTTSITTNNLNNNSKSISNQPNLKSVSKVTQAGQAAEMNIELPAAEFNTFGCAAEFEPLTALALNSATNAAAKRAVKTKNKNEMSPENDAKQLIKSRPLNKTTSSLTDVQPARDHIAHSMSSQQNKIYANTSHRKSLALAIPWRCSQMQILLFYAFILCTSILLPCGNNLVSAAKPKSATQLQQQHKQQQQHDHHHQQGHQAHQPAAGHNGVGGGGGGGSLPSYSGLGIPVAAGGTGADLTPPTYQVVSSQTSNEETEFVFPAEQSDEQLFDEEEQNLNIVELEEEEQNKAYGVHYNESNHANVTKAPLFPKDLFTKEQLENGAVICHIMGVIYMFVALAIVCDEFFVPSLDVIIEKLDITDDVAGATFMAAGGSAPELFTSVIGVFISFDDVGIGTIVGSAVFNILFVIGMCALFSKTILSLTWWPLFRDCTFYSISLMVLIYFFRDNFIYWWEALILFFIYIAYVAFMKWNVQVERFVKRLVTKNKVTRVRSTDQLMPAGNAANSSETSMATQPGGSVTSRAASETRSGPPGSSSGAGGTGNSSGGTAGSTHTGAKFRHGLLQLMIHTIDPLHDDDVPGKVDEKATQLHAIASLKVLLDATKPQRGGATTSAANHVKINLKETTLADRPNGNIDTTLDSANEIEDEPEPLSMAWPDTARKRLTYILVAPLLIPMWLTLPDTRTPRGKKYYPVTFIGSILWIAAFSYLMVWWANVAGDTARIPPEVMGLTFLAAGTSIPDLITSVIVARKGFGDMAVSSSVGSNIFDVTVGLPIPWLIYGIIYGAPVEVNSVGMVCSITILFMMLIFVVMSIACFRWKMNRGLGFTMFLLYFVFVAVSLMFEYDTLQCPV